MTVGVSFENTLKACYWMDRRFWETSPLAQVPYKERGAQLMSLYAGLYAIPGIAWNPNLFQWDSSYWEMGKSRSYLN